MPKARIDWEAEVMAWRAMKTANPLLGVMDFYRARGLNVKTASRKIGGRLADSWRMIQGQASAHADRQYGINLARELATLFTVGKALHAYASRQLLPRTNKDDPTKLLPPELPAEDTAAAARVVSVGQSAMLEVTKILTGGQPLQPPKMTEPEFRWNEPIPRSRKKPQKKRSR